jgi:predicted alpha/beta hydrolase family esterase
MNKLVDVILYVPGLGDHSLSGRRKLLSLWHYKNTNIEISAIEWQSTGSWEDKLGRLVKQIDDISRQGMQVSLVGESAGASAVMQAFRLRSTKIRAIVLLCGKSQYPESVAPRLYERNPVLREAITGSAKVVNSLTPEERSKILNLHPIFDPVVPIRETRIIGVKASIMPIIGHATSIIFANTLWSWRIVRFIKKSSPTIDQS